MKSRNNRALLAGASVIALGVSMATAAQAAPPPQTLTPGTFTTPPAFQASVTATATPAFTNKATFATGATQGPSGGASTITNGSSFVIQAVATAAGNSSATATAKFDNGLIQTAQHAGLTATATITNNGTMTVQAVAHATATTNNANAHATIQSDGINQDVSNAKNAQAVLTNSGALTISSSATAIAPGNADATANLATRGFAAGIQQTAAATGAKGSAASALLTNNATLNINATAVANAGFSAVANANLGVGISDEAQANADMGAGIFLTALGDFATNGSSAVLLSNSGTLNIESIAVAEVTGSKTTRVD